MEVERGWMDEDGLDVGWMWGWGWMGGDGGEAVDVGRMWGVDELMTRACNRE